jgi:hypothetical protein
VQPDPAGDRSSTRNRFLVQVQGKYGYISRTGKLVIKPQFDGAFDFAEDRALVNVGGSRDIWSSGFVGGLWGVIDTNGRFVVRPCYDQALSFNEGLAPVRVAGVPLISESTDNSGDGLAADELGSRWGYIDRQGRWVIAPKFARAGMVSQGRCPIAIGSEMSDERWGLCDTTGAVVVPCTLRFPVVWFSHGLAAYQQNDTGWLSVGYLDLEGNVWIPASFLYAHSFSEGLAAVGVATGDSARCGFIDTAGRMVIPATYGRARDFHEGLAAVDTSDGEGSGGRWVYIRTDGTPAFGPDFDDALDFSEGLAAVKVGEKWGYIDRNGRWVIAPRFDSAEGFVGGLAKASLGNRLGCIDRNGRFAWSTTPPGRGRP